MNEIMNLLSTIGTIPALGIGGVVIALTGYSSFKIVKKYKNRNKKYNNFENKSDISNDAYKGNNQDKNFDPDTYTVNTEENTDNHKKLSGSILRPRADSIDDFLKEDLPLSGSASHDTQMRQELLEQQDNVTERLDLPKTQIPKHLTANSESRYFINKALNADKNNDKNLAIENISNALKTEPNQSEKLRFSTILKNYTSRNDSLISLFIAYPSFLATQEELDFNLNELNQEDTSESDFELAKAKAQREQGTGFKYKSIPPGSVDRFSHLDSNLAAPNITLSQRGKMTPKIMDNPPTLPHVSADKAFASDINELPNESHEDITNIFKNISQLNSKTNIKDDEMTQSKIADDFNNLLSELGPQQETNAEGEKKLSQQFSPKLAYDIWVQWMTTANGKTSFKSSMYKLKNPWTSRKAIMELSDNISEESKNSDGTKAAWSVISVQPFFDI